jgi:hypothetical protein
VYASTGFLILSSKLRVWGDNYLAFVDDISRWKHLHPSSLIGVGLYATWAVHKPVRTKKALSFTQVLPRRQKPGSQFSLNSFGMSCNLTKIIFSATLARLGKLRRFGGVRVGKGPFPSFYSYRLRPVAA